MLIIRPTSQQPSAKLVELNKCNTFDMILSIASASVSNLARFLAPHAPNVWIRICSRHLLNQKR
jgi:hypothetical protein